MSALGLIEDEIAHPEKRAFLIAFAETGSRKKAAEISGVARRSHYNWLRNDPEYAKAFREAIPEAADTLEDQLVHLGFEGNVTALIFLLKGLRPEKYRERSDILHKLDPNALTDEQLADLQEFYLSRATDPPEVKNEIRRLAGDVVVEATSEVVPPKDGENEQSS